METFMNLLAGFLFLTVFIRFFRMMISAVRGAVFQALHRVPSDRKIAHRHRAPFTAKKKDHQRNQI
jgi:hypothetical protein